MRKILAVIGGVVIATATAAGADDHQEGICPPLDSGKVDVEHTTTTVTVNAPPGFLITGYCVKAGSVRQGNGPELVQLLEPAASWTFGHSSGKDVSHWSASFEAAGSPEPEEPVEEPVVDVPVEEPPAPVDLPPVEFAPPPVSNGGPVAVPQGVGSPEWRTANPDSTVEFG